jgi:hypothetical protein
VHGAAEAGAQQVAQHLRADASLAPGCPDHCDRGGLEEVAHGRGSGHALALLVASKRGLGQRRGYLDMQLAWLADDLHREAALAEDLQHAAVLG